MAKTETTDPFRQRNLRAGFIGLVLLGGTSLIIFVFFISTRTNQISMLSYILDDISTSYSSAGGFQRIFSVKDSDESSLSLYSDRVLLSASFLANNPNGTYHDNSPCYYTRLRKAPKKPEESASNDQKTAKCRKHEPSAKSCEEANKYFNNPNYDPTPRRCSTKNNEDICQVISNSRSESPDFKCDVTVCGGSLVSITKVDAKTGLVASWQYMNPFDVNKVKEMAKKALDEGFSFVFLRCNGFQQVLMFPPKRIQPTVPLKKRININTVVVDSVARTHFFSGDEEIIYDDTIPATVLDFEFFHGISMHTFDNIRPLFSSNSSSGSPDFKCLSDAQSIPGNCVRLLGKSFSSIRQRSEGKSKVTTFDLHVTAHASVPLTEDVVFKVAVSHGDGVYPALKSYSRHSLYKKFKNCSDKQVDLKLCVCSNKPRTCNTSQYMNEVISPNVFGSKSEVKDISGGCVFLITRCHGGFTLVYEVANLCPVKKQIVFEGSDYYVDISMKLPRTIDAEPNTAYFVISGVRRIMALSYLEFKTRVV
ncbi:predicted protein [Nematostella vectensis]|uniref:Uncharacterized protein n=1 Tax=Nematostella vectensis TaxID=45351 RepID=A7SR38_NEMVE|nr:predicted protein [Nematostella vectensis]|eukprot:XP_001625926.1 predicted protein [Nematostella vectensis]